MKGRGPYRAAFLQEDGRKCRGGSAGEASLAPCRHMAQSCSNGTCCDKTEMEVGKVNG